MPWHKFADFERSKATKMENRLSFYNTLTKKVEQFIPNEDGKVTMYTCGPTVYHFAHIGNLRSYIMEDLLEKTLRYIGYDVKRVMNITDVGHLSSDADTGEDRAQSVSISPSWKSPNFIRMRFLATAKSSISRRPMWWSLRQIVLQSLSI